MANNRYIDLSQGVIEEVLGLIDEGVANFEIEKQVTLSTYMINKIRDEYDRPPSLGTHDRYSDEQKEQAFELIHQGNTIYEISRLTGVKTQTLRGWRHGEIAKGNHVPEFEREPNIPPPIKYRYPDEEMIELAYLNQGVGTREFIAELGIQMNTIIELFSDYKDFCGVDLYNFLQNQKPAVSAEEYQNTVGVLPEKSLGRITRFLDEEGREITKVMFLLPKEEFDWGPYKKREWFSDNID